MFFLIVSAFFCFAVNDKIAATQQLFNQDKEYLKAFISFLDA